ncbi:Lrp/AsnC family transcriptional regulator [Paludibacterium yongneupense]|uniref:Lrp/AsnC family transcriptional regulator n=1 Tax=Paludibacterium yongneupense TaxID=400061 RepID=UPI0004271CF9|nr:Lrp/AsnC family transcriptional regulator [Paludibacterium yongneupense]
MKKIDEVDRKILELLRQNARMSLAEIARQVHKSRTAVEARIARLEEDGVILGYRTEIDEQSLPLPANQAYVIIRHAGGADCSVIWQQLRGRREVLECHSLFGALDVIVRVGYQQFEELMSLKALLLDNPRVVEVSISPILKTWFPPDHPA